VLALVTGAGTVGEARPHDPKPLERFRPQLVYDADERFFAQPVSLPPERPRVVPGDLVYGRIAAEGDERWLQYWLFFAENPQDRGVVATGRHAGDWELVQFRLGLDGRPDLATMSQHSWAEGCAFRELELNPQGRPRVFVANGSHAIYSRRGTHDRPFPDPNDEADGEGRAVRPDLARIGAARPSWVRYEGLWGPSRAGIVPGEKSSPPGPMFQAHRAWQAPSSYHRAAVRCGSGAPDAWWHRAGVALAGFGIAALALAWRRRRRA
jgi:hypothetical protein